MFTSFGQSHRHCDGLDRRQFLRLGSLGFGGITLANLLRQQAQASQPVRPKSVIYIVLSGGISHIDTHDPKPNAPAEFRGEFKSISTKLSGIRFCEHFPKQASILDRLALLRGVRSIENDHFLSEVYTGLPRTAGKRPAFGSVASRLVQSNSALPAYVSLKRQSTDQFEFEKPYYAGSGHAPFRPFGEALENLTPVKELEKLQDRKELLKSFDTMRRDLDKADALIGMDRFQTQALEMITSPRVREAFDLSKEPIRNIARYGKGKYTHQADKNILYDWDGKPFVLARRLVEAGVRVVTLSVGSWDHHSGPSQHIFQSYRHVLPVLDQSIYALVTDLEDRGLINDVLVVVLGEFGRTPKLSYPGPGREHWSDAGCVLFAGGGLKMGQVIGETDSKAERAKTGKTNFQNIVATIYHVLGIDASTTLSDFSGRPQLLLDDPKPIAELVD
jgi:hypothetical protein